jgi:hypothetical protein
LGAGAETCDRLRSPPRLVAEHESTRSTEIYLHADDKLKQEAIDRTTPTGTLPGRYQPPDRVLAFLERL